MGIVVVSLINVAYLFCLHSVKYLNLLFVFLSWKWWNHGLFQISMVSWLATPPPLILLSLHSIKSPIYCSLLNSRTLVSLISYLNSYYHFYVIVFAALNLITGFLMSSIVRVRQGSALSPLLFICQWCMLCLVWPSDSFLMFEHDLKYFVPSLTLIRVPHLNVY